MDCKDTLKYKLDKSKEIVSFFLVMLKILCLALSLVVFLPPHLRAQEEGPFATLNFVVLGQGDFLLQRRAIVDGVIAASPFDMAPEEAATDLTLAELHLTHLLLPEAATYLAALEPGTLTPEEDRRYRTIALALDLLGGPEGLEQAVSRSQGWGQGAALRAAAFARLGNVEALRDLLPRMPAALDGLSPALRVAVLPDLLSGALDAGDWDAASFLAALFDDHAELRNGATYRYLLARAAEERGELLLAFDGYVKAARGRNVDAHRARIALVRLGRRTDTLPLGDAVKLLDQARWAWSGDAVAQEGFELLADYALETGDRLTALSALDRLLLEIDSPEGAEAVRQRVGNILRDYYAAGEVGQIDLDSLLEGHAVIEARWRFERAFVQGAVPLPRTLLAAGITSAAAREFRNLRELAIAAQELEMFETDPAYLRDLWLGEARALLAGGQADGAVDLLMSVGLETGESDAEAERLLVSALSRAGRTEELAALRARALDARLARSRAEALYDKRKWAAAHDAFMELWARYPSDFAFPDATRLTLAAHEIGAADTLERLAGTFPLLSDMSGWRDIALRLSPEVEPPETLTSEAMRSSMSDADRALDTVLELTGAGAVSDKNDKDLN